MKYKKNDEITTAAIANELGMLDINKGSYFVLDDIGKDIWEVMNDFVTTDEIVTKMQEIYDIDSKKCSNDVCAFIEKMNKLGLIIEE